MTESKSTAERAEVERVAQEYRERGYDVVVSPAASELPHFLRDLRPDIVAHGRGESVLIEVKHRPSARDGARVRAIAQTVESHPGWRFVLVATPPAALPDERFRAVSRERVQTLLSEAIGLRTSGHRHASLLLAWSAFEGAMRLAAERYEVHAPRPDAASLLRALVSNGVLDREAYQPLHEVLELRNALAHGLDPTESTDLDAAIEALRRAAESLLKDLDRPDVEAQA
jgi:uncharacterized protein YutE (UPF0331/DUF86 family)